MYRLCPLVLSLALVGCANVNETEPPVQTAETEAAAAPASNNTFQVKFETTKGDFVVKVHEGWSPNGARHFRELVEDGFYTDIAFFRVVKGFMAQFGISGEPAMNEKWQKSIKDDPVVQSNTRGYVTYAKTGMPNSRSTQLFINYKDNSFLDKDGFSPFGIVLDDGMDVIDALNGEYGDPPGATQEKIRIGGNAYLKRVMPNLDYVKRATIIAENGQPVAPAEDPAGEPAAAAGADAQ